jgi:hypothetical protein
MQRYIEQLPAAGEVPIFDRSWYNGPGVERVMGYCIDDAAKWFLKSAWRRRRCSCHASDGYPTVEHGPAHLSPRSVPARSASVKLISSYALSFFLGMTLMSMQLWTLAGTAGPLLVVVAVHTNGRSG